MYPILLIAVKIKHKKIKILQNTKMQNYYIVELFFTY